MYVLYFRTSKYHLLSIFCFGNFFKTDQFRSRTMELFYFVNLIFILAVNLLFFFSGICLNSLVVVSFWRSVQQRKKLCYFTIMILSCCDLLVALTNHPLTALLAMLWLTKKMNACPEWLLISVHLPYMLSFSSPLALLVMSVDRYLATHYPLFHRTSVTKGKLLTFFAFLFFIQITVTIMSINDLVIPYQVGLLILGIIFISPMIFINYKLFTVTRKSLYDYNGISPEMKKFLSLKNISSCLLVVACLLVLSIPLSVYIVLRLTSKENEKTLDNAGLAALWVATTISMNSTFNCLIFYWKNKILRDEGMKVIKSMKICRRNESCPVHPEQSNINGI